MTSVIDFDQAFAASSPPEKMLGTPMEYLAPEVAGGGPPGPASDVWALGCAILRLRSGTGPFTAYDATSPADVLRYIVRVLGDLPSAWKDTLFDYDGQPTKDQSKGSPIWKLPDAVPLRDWIARNIWDKPNDDGVAESMELPAAGRRGEESTGLLTTADQEDDESGSDCGSETERHEPY